MSAEGLTAAKRREIAAAGGRVREFADGYAVDFPDDPIDSVMAKIAAHEERMAEAYAAAAARAAEYGTVAVPLLRTRGDGWFAATSHGHPGWWRLVQLDMATGEPVQHNNGGYCECEFGAGGGMWCHHAAAARHLWEDLRLAGAELGADLVDLLERSITAREGAAS